MVIQTNFPDRVRINPPYLLGVFDQLSQKYIEFDNIVYEMEYIFKNTDVFWQGTAADETRRKFQKQAMPFFEDLQRTFNEINKKGSEWVKGAIEMEASLQTP